MLQHYADYYQSLFPLSIQTWWKNSLCITLSITSFSPSSLQLLTVIRLLPSLLFWNCSSWSQQKIIWLYAVFIFQLFSYWALFLLEALYSSSWTCSLRFSSHCEHFPISAPCIHWCSPDAILGSLLSLCSLVAHLLGSQHSCLLYGQWLPNFPST